MKADPLTKKIWLKKIPKTKQKKVKGGKERDLENPPGIIYFMVVFLYFE